MGDPHAGGAQPAFSAVAHTPLGALLRHAPLAIVVWTSWAVASDLGAGSPLPPVSEVNQFHASTATTCVSERTVSQGLITRLKSWATSPRVVDVVAGTAVGGRNTRCCTLRGLLNSRLQDPCAMARYEPSRGRQTVGRVRGVPRSPGTFGLRKLGSTSPSVVHGLFRSTRGAGRPQETDGRS
jgi:hypothetical protein